MAYNIKLFVHGVPNGQDIWGNPGSDAKYIDAFYGRQSTVSSQMFLEIMQFGNETNAYYTYYYKNNRLQEKSGRTSGYFAITLRINYYYADIQNIYNLLEAAFNKFIIGSILEYTSGGGCRFKVSQFNQANDHLIALEKELMNYLMQFSSDQDFIPLNGFKSNGQNECSTINLLEATSNIISTVKSAGKISVSPLYPSAKEQQIISRMNSEIQAANSNAQQQIAAAQQKAQQDIQAVKNEYKETDRAISQLRAQRDKDNKEISQLNTQIKELNTKLQNAQAYKTLYEKSQKELDEIKKKLSGLSGISELLSISSIGSNGFASFVKKIHPFLDFFVMFTLLCIIVVTLPKSCENIDTKLAGWFSSDGNKEEVDNHNEQEQVVELNKGVEVSDKEVQTMNKENLQSLKEKFPNAKIDFPDINKTNPMKAGFTYKVSLLNVEGDLKGEWVSNDFHIYNEQVTPKKEGACTISYIVTGDTLVTRTINVNR